MIMSMIPWFRWMRAPSSVFAVMLMFFVSIVVAQEGAHVTARIPACRRPLKGQSLVGWGKYGLFFSVPKHGVKILGGKPDVDYVKFVIKPTNHDAALALWFGGMAFNPDPPEALRNSAS